METSNQILAYQRRTWKEYKQVVGLPCSYSYLFGNPVKVHVPIDTATNGVMIIGAYPTAHFNVIGSHRDVPVSDHLYPFSNEIYFDGSGVNFVKSGKEIEEFFLKPLGFSRHECWITDLVKVFLFKEGHIKKYNALGFGGHIETRSQFREFGEKSKRFIDEEILLAQPSIILGLGAEVNSIMLGLSTQKTLTTMENAIPVEYKVEKQAFIYYAVPHPGFLMRDNTRSSNWHKALDKTLNNINKSLLQNLK